MIRLIVEWDGEEGKVTSDPPNVGDYELKGILMGALKSVVHRIRQRESELIANSELARIARRQA